MNDIVDLHFSENENALCWRGTYTYGSSYCRGTSLHVHPTYGRIWCELGCPKIHDRELKMETDELTCPLSDDTVLFFRNDSRALRFDDKADFDQYTCTKIDWDYFDNDKFQYAPLDRMKAYGADYAHMFILHKGKRCGDLHADLLFSNDEHFWEKIQKEMNYVFQSGNLMGVRFEWF